MKNIILFLFLICFNLIIGQDFEFIRNVKIENDTNFIIVHYDLKSIKKEDSVLVKLEIYNQNGDFYELKTLSGDIGSVSQGLNKTIYWNARKDGYIINNEINVQIYANRKVGFSKKNQLLRSLIFPGSGDYKVRNGKHHFIYGIVGYGGYAGAIALNYNADLAYKKYLASYQLNESKKHFNQAQNFRILSFASASVSTLAWSLDLFFLNRRLNKLNKKSDYIIKEFQKTFKTKNIKPHKANIKNASEIAYDIASKFYLKDNLDSALYYYQKSKSLNPTKYLLREENIATIEGLIQTKNYLTTEYSKNKIKGDEYFALNDLENAEIHYKEALKICETINEKYQIINQINAVEQLFLQSQIEKIKNSILDRNKKIKFDLLVADGEKLFQQKKLIESKDKFIEASYLYFELTIADDKIAYIDSILQSKIKNETERKFNIQIAIIDKFINKGQFQTALDSIVIFIANYDYTNIDYLEILRNKELACHQKLEQQKKDILENKFKVKLNSIEQLIKNNQFENALKAYDELLLSVEFQVNNYPDIIEEKKIVCKNKFDSYTDSKERAKLKKQESDIKEQKELKFNTALKKINLLIKNNDLNLALNSLEELAQDTDFQEGDYLKKIQLKIEECKNKIDKNFKEANKKKYQVMMNDVEKYLQKKDYLSAAKTISIILDDYYFDKSILSEKKEYDYYNEKFEFCFKQLVIKLNEKLDLKHCASAKDFYNELKVVYNYYSYLEILNDKQSLVDDCGGGDEVDFSLLFNKTHNSVFLILAENDQSLSQGSGFFLSESGVAISNYHVFENMDIVFIMTSDGQYHEIEKILEQNRDFDYVIFKVKKRSGVTFQPVKIAKTIPSIGKPVYAIGNPEGLEQTISNGIISGFRNDNLLIQTNAEITHGSSGGALFNEKGEVIGITKSGLDVANLNFAINLHKIKSKFIKF